MKKAQVYTVEYGGKFENGDVFDASPAGSPLEFIGESNSVIKGFEEGIKGMKTGQTKEVKINPDEGYGPHREELVLELPLSAIEGLPNPKEGMEIAATLESGQQVPVKILKLAADKVTLDFNHPLAGKKLIFKIKLVSVRDATEEEVMHGHVHREHSHD
jgi:FKBP-type peptidyl-prolyl cis-trans isomerase 2